jgi:hypothetical protein
MQNDTITITLITATCFNLDGETAVSSGAFIPFQMAEISLQTVIDMTIREAQELFEADFYGLAGVLVTQTNASVKPAPIVVSKPPDEEFVRFVKVEN